MSDWTIEAARSLFNELNSDDSSTRKVVDMGRPNSANRFEGPSFVSAFVDDMDAQLDLADAVFKSVGA